MVDKHYTQRGFAAAAGISTATVVQLIKSGRIQKGEGGRIPATELRKFFIDVMRKCSANGTLMLCVGKSDDEVAELKQSVDESYQANGVVARYFADINEIIRTAADYTQSEASTKINIVKYNKQVLDAFIKKYKSSAKEYFSNLVSSGRFPEFSNLPASVAYEIVFYGKSAVDLSCMSVIQNEMDSRYRVIIDELCLTGDNNAPLFKRTDLDAEFYNKSGAIYNLFVGDDPVLLKKCDSILQEVAQSALGSHLKSSIRSLLDDAFYTICNVDGEDNYLELISSGVYGRILVKDGDYPAELEIALKFAEGSGNCAVTRI